jgi:hypothetical protein
MWIHAHDKPVAWSLSNDVMARSVSPLWRETRFAFSQGPNGCIPLVPPTSGRNLMHYEGATGKIHADLEAGRLERVGEPRARLNGCFPSDSTRLFPRRTFSDRFWKNGTDHSALTQWQRFISKSRFGEGDRSPSQSTEVFPAVDDHVNLLTLALPIAFRSDLQALFNFALFWDASRK